ncbi:LutC/YkgG family protein [Butyricimonas paravirosa]|uniref:LutC/YkgG family protein n=1 Tax=Butyricimonas paravirosa TaxID=1472417 RepID=UPI00210B7879|nr:LUD domain-containing protein [Butyricimonas paravirosa]MCQ4872673.1 LUD domain-containing protein [Butyricimonas paravirosa]
MSSKEDILARLKKHAIDPVERPGMEFTPITYADPLAQFEKILKAVGANFVLLEEGQDVNEVIRSVYPNAKSIASNLPEITCATVNPDNLDDPRELNGTDVGVIRGEFGVLENGMVWINQHTRYKAIFFISEALVILLDRNRLVNNMHEAYKQPGFDDFGYGCFIAGPSKTADIEQALVIGAHGARAVTVILS